MVKSSIQDDVHEGIKYAVRAFTKPSPKIHIILINLDQNLNIINIQNLSNDQLGLEYFAEQVLESCHNNFSKFFQFMINYKINY